MPIRTSRLANGHAAAPLPATKGRPKPKAKRELIDWNRNDRLRIAKQLAWAIYHEHSLWTDQKTLWCRFEEALPRVMQRLTGRCYTFFDLFAETLHEQDKEITPNRLYGRADSTERYGEFNEWTGLVQATYRQLLEDQRKWEQVEQELE